MGTQASQYLGDGTQFVDWDGSKSCDLIRIRWAEFPAHALQIKDVTDKGEGRVVTDKVTIQDAQETTQLDSLPGLFSDFTVKGILDRFPKFYTARGQTIYWFFVAVFRVQQDFTAGLADSEDYLASSVRTRLPSIAPHVVIGLDTIEATKRLTVSLCKALNFRLVNPGCYRWS